MNNVCVDQWMAASTKFMRQLTHTTTKIFSNGYRLKMIRIATTSNSTKMVQMQTGGDATKPN